MNCTRFLLLSFKGSSALRKESNCFDKSGILKQYLCQSEDTKSKLNENQNQDRVSKQTIAAHSRVTRVLSSAVRLVQGTNKSLAIQVRGEAPFLYSDEFDSAKSFLYINEDNSHAYLYLYCPNVTEGSIFKKWSLVNMWSKAKLKYSLPLESTIYNCPHSLFNQTLIAGYWNTKG